MSQLTFQLLVVHRRMILLLLTLLCGIRLLCRLLPFTN